MLCSVLVKPDNHLGIRVPFMKRESQGTRSSSHRLWVTLSLGFAVFHFFGRFHRVGRTGASGNPLEQSAIRVGKLQEEQETPERKVFSRRSERADKGEEARLLKRKYHLAESWQDVGSLAIRGGVARGLRSPAPFFFFAFQANEYFINLV